jgi:hypothetical protein
MIWDLVWIWVALASLLTVISVWRHMSAKRPDASAGNNTPGA